MKGSQLGYILNSDMTVTSTTHSGKTPIGVVVCSYSGGGGQAMALKSVGEYEWGGYGTDISSLTNYTSASDASQDITSYINSTKIKAQGNSNTYPAAWQAYNYTSTGTKAGDWCLPAAGIFTAIYANQNIINTGFNRAGGTPFTNNISIWTSSEATKYSTWRSDFTNNYGVTFTGIGGSYKNSSFEVRPVIGFCQGWYEYDKNTDTCKPCDYSYRFSCTGANQTGGIGSTCDGRYQNCSCASNYFWNGEFCAPENACMKGSKLGYILNSDMTVTSSKQSGKTPIGVVVCSYASGGGQAMALKTIGNDKWSTEYVNISGLTNYLSEEAAFQNYASCENSAKIRAQGNSSKYPAVWLAYNYTTTGTKIGDWCLPAAGILSSINANQKVINMGFSQAGGAQLTYSPIPPIWSSTEINSGSVWRFYDDDEYGLISYVKQNHGDVRPVIEF